MLPLKKILCPTDFSEPSYEAIRTANEIALHFAAELCLLHVVPSIPVLPAGAKPKTLDVSSYELEIEASSKNFLQEVVSKLEAKEPKVRLIVLHGNPPNEIARTADEEKTDLIVIATRGHTGRDRLYFGSVAERVVRLAKCPVLTIPT